MAFHTRYLDIPALMTTDDTTAIALAIETALNAQIPDTETVLDFIWWLHKESNRLTIQVISEDSAISALPINQALLLDGTGTAEMAGAAANSEFFIQPAVGEVFSLSSVRLFALSPAEPKLSEDEFGGNVGKLTDPIRIQYTDNAPTTVDLDLGGIDSNLDIVKVFPLFSSEVTEGGEWLVQGNDVFSLLLDGDKNARLITTIGTDPIDDTLEFTTFSMTVTGQNLSSGL